MGQLGDVESIENRRVWNISKIDDIVLGKIGKIWYLMKDGCARDPVGHISANVRHSVTENDIKFFVSQNLGLINLILSIYLYKINFFQEHRFLS